MNNRDYKSFASNTIHHVYNRGNGKMDIFKDAQDYANCLKRLGIILNLKEKTPASVLSNSVLRVDPLPEGAFSMIAYCLMPNHFHFLIRQNTELPISALVSKLCTSYSKYFNKKYNHVGGLFQDQFKSIPVLTDSYLLWLSAYIHQNPLMAKLVPNLLDYSYSSYLEYVYIQDLSLCDTSFILNMFQKDIKKYQDFVIQSYEKLKLAKEINTLLLD